LTAGVRAAIRSVGHAERWDAGRVGGSLQARDGAVSFMEKGRRIAIATVSRDRTSLEVEVEPETRASSEARS